MNANEAESFLTQTQNGIANLTGDELDNLKKVRAPLQDQLFQLLQAEFFCSTQKPCTACGKSFCRWTNTSQKNVNNAIKLGL